MNELGVIKFLGQRGARFGKRSLDQAISYFSHMIKDKRVITLFKDGKLHSIMAFSLGEDFDRFYRKHVWRYVPHDPSGKILYVEMVVSKSWDKDIRKQFRDEILKLYPQIEEAHWHKWATWGDRHVMWRRNQHV